MTHILAVADDLEQVLVADKVESREGRTLALEVLAERLLDLGEEVGESLEALLRARDVEHVEDERRLEDLLHDGEEFGVDVAEPLRLDGKEVFDIGAAGEDASAGGKKASGLQTTVARREKDALKVDPLTLDVDPDVEEEVNAVEAVLPR